MADGRDNPLNWQKIVEILAEQVPAARFDAWIRPVQVRVEGHCLTLCTPSRFFLDGLRDRYQKQIEEIATREFGSETQVAFCVDSSLAVMPEPEAKRKPEANSGSVDGFIDPRFTFANFVVGSSNEFCYAACRAVADQPGEIYNPLYIHGGVGLGKTHLINAVANSLLEKDGTKIAYRTSERFTNELITAIRNGATQQFRHRYRQVDVLIIDDVQFIAGKASTQEEFFHTFNALYEVRKQIILTSDRSPREMNHLEERLKSRFNWGLVADIQPPDLETRLAILARKAELAGVSLPEDVAYLLASRITSNVRELEGALTRLTAHATLTGKTINMDFAKHVLRDLLHEEVRAVSVEDIQKKIANYYNIRIQDMRSSKRSRNVAFPRQIAMYASKDLTTLSLPDIGERFGGKDHTTILYAVRKVERMMGESDEFREEVERILQLLKS
ncbi:MAG TPA: chromosomal replication initiator protein DnaA [Mariprofundaceae bacterium]|nr:chromosomal replication initiator protein DnaA [Mariprofundaceae bacterium]